MLHEGVTLVGEIESDKSSEEIDDDLSEDEAASTIVMGDDSVEINVEELVEKIEASNDLSSEKKRDVKKRLEELHEQRDSLKELDSTYNFNLDDDL